MNTAAEGIPPVRVEQALRQYYLDRRFGMEGRVGHFEQWNAARSLAGQLTDLSPEEIGLCSSSSEAFNLAALALNLKPGDEVVVNELEYPSGASPWLNPNWGVRVKCWRMRDGILDLDDLPPLLSPRTRMVVCSLVSFWNGYRIDLPEIAKIIHHHSQGLVACDITQGIGRIPLDLRGADLIVSSAHKWLLSSHGCGIVGIPATRARELTPPAGGWFNQSSPYASERFEKIEYRRGAAAFMTGMPNFPSVYALRCCMEYLLEIGVSQIDEQIRPLLLACLDGLKELGVKLISPDDPRHLAGILAFVHQDAERIQEELKRNSIFVMRTLDRIRISLHGYNTAEDVKALLNCLRGVL